MGQAAPIHSKLLNDAARQILMPIGLVQKGRSRTWLDDHGWWTCVVEFQPSSWSPGSYLNVGCMWLWNPKSYISFDEGGRVESFSRFHDGLQFQSESERMARRAVMEVNRYRDLFPSIDAVANYYMFQPTTAFWTSFHAAIACAFAGHEEESRAFFRNVTEVKNSNLDWVLAAQADANELVAILHDAQKFRDVVTERVRRTRLLQRLPEMLIDFR